MAANQARRPAGTPAGGQWAPSGHAEPDIDLRERPARRALVAAALTATSVALSTSPAGAVQPAWDSSLVDNVPVEGSSVELSWMTPVGASGAVAYRVEVDQVPEKAWQIAATKEETENSPSSQVTATIGGLRPGRTYLLEVVGLQDGRSFGVLGPTSVSVDPTANSPWPAPSSCPPKPLPPFTPPGLTCADERYLEDIDSARESEGLGPMALPTDYSNLPAPQQVLVVTNIERGSRGLPTFPGLSPVLNRYAEIGARAGTDPSGPPRTSWGSNWASTSDALEADFLWMYEDGYSKYGSINEDCKTPDDSLCWGHRRNLLADYGPHPELGVGVDGESLSQLFVAGQAA